MYYVSLLNLCQINPIVANGLFLFFLHALTKMNKLKTNRIQILSFTFRCGNNNILLNRHLKYYIVKCELFERFDLNVII